MENELKNIPPHSLEAEQSVLGAVLLDSEAIVKIADFLSGEDFYFGKHAQIFDAVLELWDARSPIDILTLGNNLKEKKLLENVGGNDYLIELTSSVPTASHVFEYAQIVKQKSTLRKLISAGEKVRGLGYDETREIDELLEDAEKSIFSISQAMVRDKFVHIKEILQTTYEKLALIQESEDKSALMGVPTHYRNLDKIIFGLRPGELIIVAARPSMGKTSFALSLAQNVTLKGNKSVGIFSLEMGKEQLVERLFCGMLGVDSRKLNTGELSDEDFSRIGGVMDELSRTKLYIDDSAGGNLNELKSKARRLQMEHGLDLIVIDYLQLMSTGKTAYLGNRVQEISEISRALKGLARELNVPIIALSQLSRAVENRPGKIPQLADLRESGAIEQDADIVLMMYREDYYEEDSDRPGITDIFVRKHRNGPTGRVEMMFKAEQMRFYDVDYSRGEVPLPEPDNFESPAQAPRGVGNNLPSEMAF